MSKKIYDRILTVMFWCFIAFCSWSVWDQYWSNQAKECFVKGGTSYSSWDGGCRKMTTITTKMEKIP